MTIVFRFDSMDSRQRVTMAMPTPEQAARHVAKVLNGGRRRGHDLWTLDEEGTEVPTIRAMAAALHTRCEIKLYDQSARCTDDVVTIERAFVAA